MNKKVLWVVGLQCAGKTLFSETLEKIGADVLHIGRAMREKYNIDEFKDSNIFAPSDTEQDVQALIFNRFSSFSKSRNTLFVVDSAPRNVQQFNLMISLSNIKEIDTEVIIILDSDSNRLKRAKVRYNNKISYFLKRELYEKDWIRELIKNCCKFNINITILNGKYIDEV